MSNIVLATKWRPKLFSEFVGQDPVVTALVNSLDKMRLHHSYFELLHYLRFELLHCLLLELLHYLHYYIITDCIIQIMQSVYIQIALSE